MVENVKTLRALIVDDDRMIQTIIKANLESVGIIPVVAGNGVEAIEAIKTNEFDFILMDIRMPHQDGLDATRWIRDIEFTDTIRHVPIFALTTYSSDAHTQEILDAGMNEHLVKPFRMENLLPLLNKYFPGAVVRK
jgi:two-component system, sensor histidine kinase